MEKPIYETYETSLKQTFVKRTDPNGSVYFIPNDPSNSDYQAYLKSLEDPTSAQSSATIQP